jgi:hypothetical protein
VRPAEALSERRSVDGFVTGRADTACSVAE